MEILLMLYAKIVHLNANNALVQQIAKNVMTNIILMFQIIHVNHAWIIVKNVHLV